MQATTILRAEHTAVLLVLEQLERATALAEGGVAVPPEIFGDILELIVVFVGHCHQGKEESAVFGRVDWSPRGARLVSRLIEEHVAVQRLAGAYADAVAAYVPGDRATAHALASAAGTYAAALRPHIASEEVQLLPSMERTVATDEDRRIAGEFDQIKLEEIGEGAQARLQRMIGTLPGRIDRWAAIPAG